MEKPNIDLIVSDIDGTLITSDHVITPTTKRSLGGGPLTLNVSSLETIGELCRRNGIQLVFFNAPQNPNAPLYRTSADREQYQQLISRLARKFGQGYFDFENSIPGPLWGVWIDGRRSAAMRADNISVVRLTERQVRILNGLNTSGVPANEHIEKRARKYTGRKFKGFRPDQRRVIVQGDPGTDSRAMICA